MIRLSEHVRTVNSLDGGALLDLRQGKMYRVNGVGSIVLELLINGNSEEVIAREISERCGVALHTAAADVREFVASLRQNALLSGDGKS
jgi:hypothetical protein